jgi:hypothetical protein
MLESRRPAYVPSLVHVKGPSHEDLERVGTMLDIVSHALKQFYEGGVDIGLRTRSDGFPQAHKSFGPFM